jgi:hypothetical protein
VLSNEELGFDIATGFGVHVSVQTNFSFVKFEDFAAINMKIAVFWDVTLIFFYPDNGGDTFLRNVGSYKIHTTSHSRTRLSLNFFHSTLPKSVLGSTQLLMYPTVFIYTYCLRLFRVGNSDT